MKTFDYIRAWREVAKPAFDLLPPRVHALLALVTELYADECQQPDLSMRFVSTDVRAAFEAIDQETLAHASRAVHAYGHWRPSNAGVPQAGETWKFSDLADQVLSARLGLPSPHAETPRSGWSTRVMEGAVRLQYSAWDFWVWEEIGYATPDVLEIAQKACSGDRSYEAVSAALKRAAEAGRPKGEGDPFALLFGTGDRYMEDDAIITQREYDFAKAIARVRADHDARVEKAMDTTERDAFVWLLERGIPVDNVIYYTHTKRFCFGWRKPMSAEFYSRLSDVLCEFQYDYDIKHESGGGAS